MNEGLPRVLRFRAGRLELGVLLPEVARIVDPAELVRVPYAHPALVGMWMDGDAQTPIFELRGLVDPRAAFAEDGTRAYLVFDTDAGPLGLRVQAVRGTLDQYEQTGESGEGIPAELALVVTARGEGVSEEGAPDEFHFFSPGAFLVALDVERPLRPSGDEAR